MAVDDTDTHRYSYDRENRLMGVESAGQVTCGDFSCSDGWTIVDEWGINNGRAYVDMRLTKKIFYCGAYLMLNIGLLFVLASSPSISKSADGIKYFCRLHNDNEYLYSSMEEFDCPMKEAEIISAESYFKVYCDYEGKHYKAEFFINGKIRGTYLFNPKGRIIRSEVGNVICMWCYGENEKVKVIIQGTEFSEYWLYHYKDDKLVKLTKYIPVKSILEHTMYNHDTWMYKTYDKTNLLIDEGEMVHPGK